MEIQSRIKRHFSRYTLLYAELPGVQAMPFYPAKGSCQIVGGVLIAMLS